MRKGHDQTGASAVDVRVADAVQIRWKEHPSNPLLRPPWGSPIIADPTFLPPEETHDGRWHMFAHSLFGIHQYASPDGLSWKLGGRPVARNALRPFLFRSGKHYWLFYEKCVVMLPALRFLPWASHIEVRTSEDLLNWSAPRVVLRPTFDWHKDAGHGRAIGNPCVVPTEKGYRLYYSAGLVFLPDCGFFEPRYIGIAESESLDGPYHPEPEPILGPVPDGWPNAGAGAMKVLAVKDGFIGFQNGIYLDAATGRSGSAVRMLSSQDWRAWQPVRDELLIVPTTGWKGSHVYAVDVRRTGDRWVLFFNARDHCHWFHGQEAIGRMDGALPSGNRAGSGAG